LNGGPFVFHHGRTFQALGENRLMKIVVIIKRRESLFAMTASGKLFFRLTDLTANVAAAKKFHWLHFSPLPTDHIQASIFLEVLKLSVF
jgi:hypothetical protein